MRVTTELVLDFESGDEISRETSEYAGPVAEAKGGSSSSTTVDKAYNARMATVAEAQQEMAEQYFDFWEEYSKPYEAAQTQANMSLLPSETALQQATLNSQLELLPGSTALTKAQNESALSLLPAQTELASAKLADSLSTLQQTAPIKSQVFGEAAAGVDVGQRMGMAQADVASQYANSEAESRRQQARMGVLPTSGRMAGVEAGLQASQAANVAGARTKARTDAENETWTKRVQALQLGMGQ